jgi:hypothetical protein
MTTMVRRILGRTGFKVDHPTSVELAAPVARLEFLVLGEGHAPL